MNQKTEKLVIRCDPMLKKRFNQFKLDCNQDKSSDALSLLLDIYYSIDRAAKNSFCSVDEMLQKMTRIDPF